MFTTQEGQQIPIWMGFNHKACRDDPGQLGYAIDTVTWIILCPMILPPQNPLGPIQGNRNRDHRLDANPHIERIAQTTSMTILHELFHVAYPRDSK